MLAGYGAERTRWDHRDAIKDAYGYQDLKGDAWWKLARWLWDRCWSGNERPIALCDLATLHLVENKVLLPGATVLERMVTSIREHTNRKTWRTFQLAETTDSFADFVQYLVPILGNLPYSAISVSREWGIRLPSGPGMVRVTSRC